MAKGNESEARELRRLGAFALALGSFWLVLGTYAVHSALPPNPIELPLEKWAHVPFWAPQGWALFTRNPRQEDLLLFVGTGDREWISASMTPHARPSNAFGLNRASRAQRVEADLLVANLSQAAWQPCEEDPASCLARAPLAASVRNPSPSPTLCGPVGVALQGPAPWVTWRASPNAITMPSRVAKLDVGC
jgi:antimicrobial peptide system SdpA family protein